MTVRRWYDSEVVVLGITTLPPAMPCGGSLKPHQPWT